MTGKKDRLIWMALELSASPRDGGGVLECELRATDMQAGETYGGIHLVANPAMDRTHTQPNSQTYQRHQEDGLMGECAESSLAFGGQGIMQVTEWLNMQAGMARLHPIGEGLPSSINILGQYLQAPALQLRTGCMDMDTLVMCIGEVNPELESTILEGLPDAGTRTSANLDSQIGVYRRIMTVVGMVA